MIDYETTKFQDTDVRVFTMTGRWDSTTSDMVMEDIQKFVDQGEQRFVLDCSKLQYLSSLGLGTLVRASDQLDQRGGQLAISGVEGVVAETLHVMSLYSVLKIYKTVEEAANALQAN